MPEIWSCNEAPLVHQFGLADLRKLSESGLISASLSRIHQFCSDGSTHFRDIFGNKKVISRRNSFTIIFICSSLAIETLSSSLPPRLENLCRCLLQAHGACRMSFKPNSPTKLGIACLSELELFLDMRERANLWPWLPHRLSCSLELARSISRSVVKRSVCRSPNFELEHPKIKNLCASPPQTPCVSLPCCIEKNPDCNTSFGYSVF